MINDYINSKRDEIIADLAELVAIPSVMGQPSEDAPFGEEPKRALLKMAELCEKSGFRVTNYENAVICADLCPEKGIELGILCHLDVVPANKSGWDTDPFELVEKDGVLYGRGAIDDKGPAVAALYALKCVKDLNIPLKKGVRLIFGTNEENGSEDLEIYKKHDKFPPKVFTPDGSFPVINIEKGMMRGCFIGKLSGRGNIMSMGGGTVINAVPDSASAVLQSVSRETLAEAISEDNSGVEFTVNSEPDDDRFIEISAVGKAAHASTPEGGINALTALVSLLNRMFDSKRLPVSDCRQRDVLRGIERLFPFGETAGSSLGLKCSDKSGGLTCVFSKFTMTRDSVVGHFDIRFPTCTTLSEVDDKCREVFSENNFGFEITLGDEPHVVSEDSDFVRRLLEVYEENEGEKGYCVAIGGGTYVHDIEGGVAFGAERGDVDYHMHGDNEFITADELLKDAVLFAKVIERLLT
ncbi:MAG: Sapep family Mn(2+)-dependent dipeptidase [Oscillospiraceae bacterium]|nr:Sapep family Mn(2+)-dependent dipeptidase [Oscillospiraceae bacterium]